MIVAAVIGILAAIVLPTLSNNAIKAKEAAAKENLRILRETVERYALKNKGVPPGYAIAGDPSSTPTTKAFTQQLCPKYLREIPKNPFNGRKAAIIIGNSEPFPTQASLTNLYGWIYKPATKTIKLNWPGTDSSGVAYLEY
jgi:type II secretory pathway pseudopilin PulG